MAENEEKAENSEDTSETEETKEESSEAAEESTDWKEEAFKLRGQLKRTLTKLEKVGAEKAKSPEKKQEGFGYAEKAYLKAEGLNSDEFKLVEEATQHTGKSIEELLGSKWFQAELKDFRETKATREAIPKGSERSSSSTRDTVEYWIAKGELPPQEQFQLRRDVVNAKLKTEKDRSKFSDTPLIK